MEYITLKVRKDDAKAVRAFIAERRKEWERVANSRRYRDRITFLLKDRIDWLQSKIDRSRDKGQAVLQWQLVVQELMMWADIATPVSKDDYRFICSRRGFTRTQRKFLEEALKFVHLKDW